ncbi:MAG: hypothetical protein PHU85_15085, partial [Phycisphaerae bacterium]|nr:hypothetical protein [Phycisphaerae bacterium]
SGIAVRVLFLLDPAVLPGRVPDNVASTVVVRSSSLVLWPHTTVTKGWLADPEKTRLEVMDLPMTSHTYLPYEASVVIRARVGEDLGSRP